MNNKDRVPRLYKVAASVLTDFTSGKDSIKNLVYQSRKKHPNLKAIFALVMETVNHREALEELADRVSLWTKEPKFHKDLALVLMTELLYGKKVLPGSSLPVTTLGRYERQLTQLVATGQTTAATAASGRDTYRTLPKYARVNSLCNNLHRVGKHLREEGWLEVMYDRDKVPYSQFLAMVKNLSERSYLLDYHLPGLLVFPPRAQLYDHPLVEDGSLILQDKASCLPVHVLAPPPGGVVLDACAAPGMKTSQLAGAVCGGWCAVLGGRPPPGARVVAVERSNKRCDTLRSILSRSRANTVVEVINSDFLYLDTNSQQFSEVTHILVDPSCSGTGMTNRSTVGEAPPAEERLQALAAMQVRLLTHALSFPRVERVVYSTCATSAEENEQVLGTVLASCSNWRLVDVMPDWERRGEGETYASCLRALPEADLCNGFFVALLERTGTGDSNSSCDAARQNKKRKKMASSDQNGELRSLSDGQSDAHAPWMHVQQTEEEQAGPVKKKKKKKKSNKEEQVSSDGPVAVDPSEGDIHDVHAPRIDEEQTEEPVSKKKKKRNKEEPSDCPSSVALDPSEDDTKGQTDNGTEKWRKKKKKEKKSSCE